MLWYHLWHATELRIVCTTMDTTLRFAVSFVTFFVCNIFVFQCLVCMRTTKNVDLTESSPFMQALEYTHLAECARTWSYTCLCVYMCVYVNAQEPGVILVCVCICVYCECVCVSITCVCRERERERFFSCFSNRHPHEFVLL